MGRSILAVFLGWAASLFVIVVVETAGHALYPMPAGADIWRQPELAVGLAIPAGAMMLVILGWALGALAGGFLAGRLVQARQEAHALAVALLILGSAVWTMLTLPHPAWVWVASVVLVPGAGWLGGRLAIRRGEAYHRAAG